MKYLQKAARRTQGLEDAILVMDTLREPTVVKKYLVPALVLFAFLLRTPSVFADSVLYEAHTPATSNYIDFCDGTYHGLRYCEFTDTFSIASDQVATAITWYDLGCSSADAANVTLLYGIANADTYAVVAETSESVQVTCTPDYPAEHNHPTTLAINPTTLVAGQGYFLLLRASNNDHVRAYWGTDAVHHDSYQVLNALSLGNLAQFRSDGVTPVAARDMLTENTVVLEGTPINATGDPVQVQVELRRLTETFTGQPTTAGSFVTSGHDAFVTVSGLIDGAYHWKIRAADGQGNVSNWQEFGSPGSSDFEIFASPLPATFPIPNPSCNSLVTFVPYAPMVVLGSNFWTCCYDTPQSYIGCYGQAYSQVFDASGSTVLARSDSIASFGYTQGCGSDLNYTTNFSGANQITLQPGVAYTFRNIETDGSSCTPGPYHPNSAYLEVTAPPRPPASLLQLKSDGNTPIPEGTTTAEPTVVFRATSSASNSFALEVELRQFTQLFTGDHDGGILTSPTVSAGQPAIVTRFGLSNGDYKWRARLLDEQNNPMGDWQEFGATGNVDFRVGNLGKAAADLAKLVIGAPYLGDGETWGGKGWNGTRYVTPEEIRTGYQYYNNKQPMMNAFGAGLDCSGLVEWAFNRAFDPLKTFIHNVIRFPGADAEHKSNSQPVAESDLSQGDLLFLDRNSDGRMDHVAMYVGESGGFDVVEAASPALGIITSRKDQFKTRLGFTEGGFRRVIPSPAIGGFAKAGSPIDLTLTDPDGLIITSSTAIQTDEEYLREIPGELYYTQSEIGPDGMPEDMIYWPVQKAGAYTVKVSPKAGAPLSATYSLEFHSGNQAMVLAENIPLSQIPDQGYGLDTSYPDALSSFVPVAIDIIPGSSLNNINLSLRRTPVAILGSSTLDVHLIDLESLTVADAPVFRLGSRSQREGTFEDINGDGFIDLIVDISTADLQLTPLDVKAELRGALVDGREIRGSDSISVLQ